MDSHKQTCRHVMVSLNEAHHPSLSHSRALSVIQTPLWPNYWTLPTRDEIVASHDQKFS